MTSKETLKELCKGCEYALSLSKQRCPFRSISNDYCDEYNDLLKDLEILELLKQLLKGAKILKKNEIDISKYVAIITDSTSKELKELLENE